MSQYADISRDSFDPARRFLRVILQQGRALLDADFNEQTSILLELVRDLNRDLHGPHWGPSNTGFWITKPGASSTFAYQLKKGTYYVAGLPCVAADDIPAADSKAPPAWSQGKAKVPYIIYLHAWERHRTPYEAPAPDAAMGKTGSFDPFVQDPALGHLDTTTRGEVTWRLGTFELDESDAQKEFVKTVAKAGLVKIAEYNDFATFLRKAGVILDDATGMGFPLANAGRSDLPVGRLAAGVKGDRLEGQKEKEPTNADRCAIETGQEYRGVDNQLIHVEIHSVAGRARKDEPPPAPSITFKWARDNASMFFPLRSKGELKDDTIDVTLLTLGRDAYAGLKQGDLVELVGAGDSQSGGDDTPDATPPFFSVDSFDRHRLTATLKLTSPMGPGMAIPDGSRLSLRRWERNIVIAKEKENQWISLSDGIQVAFQNIERMRVGDYWLIPARALTHDVIWPRQGDDRGPRLYRPAVGVKHYYAPLALVDPSSAVIDLRRIFNLDADRWAPDRPPAQS